MKSIYKFKKYVIQVILLIIGCAFMAIGTICFLLPNKLSSGGFTGIATIIYYLFNLPMGIVMFVLNIPFFIIGFFIIGKSFLIKSILGTIIYSFFLDYFERFVPLTNDLFLDCIYGGIIIGLGMGLVLKSGSSTGGSDLLTSIIKSYKQEYKSSLIIVVIDVIIVFLNMIVFKNIEIGLYSAITIFLMGKMIDVVLEGVDFTKVIFIISEKYEKIANVIIKKEQRGITGIYARGMYTYNDKMMLLCVGSRNQMAKIKKIVLDTDPKAFIIIFNAREVLGKGFKTN